MINTIQYNRIIAQLRPYQAKLVAVTKQRPVNDIQDLYALGQRDFGENRASELTNKQLHIPEACHWHFIGHLQTNKLKQIVPHTALIHSIDNAALLPNINKQAQKEGHVIDCLLQVYIAQEESKQGFHDVDLYQFLDSGIWLSYQHIRLVGLMGMASFTDNRSQITREFKHLRQVFEQVQSQYFTNQTTIFKELSMGMSNDYDLALDEGATIVRIGSLLFS